jgi:transposase
VLVELSVMEQRYQAVLAVVQDGWKVTEVAERLGVSRQSVHAWIARYEGGGLGAPRSTSTIGGPDEPRRPKLWPAPSTGDAPHP